MTLDDLEELIRKYMSTGIAVVVILVAPATGDGALPSEPQIVTIEPDGSRGTGQPPALPSAPRDGGTTDQQGSGSGGSGGSGTNDRTGANGTDPDTRTRDDGQASGDPQPEGDGTGSGTDPSGGSGTGGNQGSSGGDTGSRSPNGSNSGGSGSDGGNGSGGNGSSDSSGDSSGQSSGSGNNSTGPGGNSNRSGGGSGHGGSGSGSSGSDSGGSGSGSGSGSSSDTGPGNSSGSDSTGQGDRSGTGQSGDSGSSTGNGTTAAERFGWGTPNRVDDFSGGADQWNIYDGPGHAGQGTRSPSAVSLNNGILTITGDSSGTTAGMAWNPGQKYGRWEGRVQAPVSDPSYNALLLMWPDAENFPVGGEIDFMEMMDHTRQETNLFLHHGADNSQVNGKVQIDATEWHNWALEWTPEAITAYVDGEEWYRTTDTSIFPPGPMHLCIQLDWFPKGDSPKESVMHVDWVKQYSLDGSGDTGGTGSNGNSRGTGDGSRDTGTSNNATDNNSTGDTTTSDNTGSGGNGQQERGPVREAVRRMFSWG